jgi:uncharacterized protein YndB with AHSA1/START domain
MSTHNEASHYKTLNITRTFNVPRHLVWAAWTTPEHFKEWYAPDHFTVPVCELDVRPGGQLRVDMKGPDGMVYPSSGVFKEVIKPERLAFTNSPLDADGNKLFEVLHTATFTEHDGKTVLSLTSQVVSAGPDAAPYLTGMEAGLAQAIQKLDRLVGRLLEPL